MENLILRAEADYLLASKVYPVVEDNGVRESEVTHGVLSKKLDNLLTSDFGEWHHFDPFSEVVGGYQQEPQLRLCSGEWTNHIQSPLHEEPRTLQNVKIITRSV